MKKLFGPTQRFTRRKGTMADLGGQLQKSARTEGLHVRLEREAREGAAGDRVSRGTGPCRRVDGRMCPRWGGLDLLGEDGSLGSVGLEGG